MTTTTRTALSTLKQADLKRLAFLTGLHSTGTKTSLTTTLRHELPRPRVAGVTPPSRTTPKILSIDMGIRNLAYCVLDLHKGTEFLRHRPDQADFLGVDGKGTDVVSDILPHLTLTAWQRLVVNETPPLPSAESASAEDATSVTNVPPNDSTSTTAYEPLAYAKLAYKLVSNLLITHKPTTVIIERQRWRSGGASSVLEWTIRVNMFEGMICAVLETLRQLWLLRGQAAESNAQSRSEGRRDDALMGLEQFPDVYSVSPKRVFDFWSDKENTGQQAASEGEEGLKGDERVNLKSSKAQKQLKISIVESWLRSHALQCDSEAAAIRDAFLDKLFKQKGSKSRPKSDAIAATVEKLDDLADCLLQGVTWVQWEANRNAVLPQLDLSEEHEVVPKEVKKTTKPSRAKKKS